MQPIEKLCPLFGMRDYMKKPFDVITDDHRRFRIATSGKYILGLEIKDGEELGIVLDVPDHALSVIKMVVGAQPLMAQIVDRAAFTSYCGDPSFPGPCPHCSGGANKPTCPDCAGTGETECDECGHERDCAACDGVGDSCGHCYDIGIYDAAESRLHKNRGVIGSEGFNTMYMARILACAPDGEIAIQVKPDHGGIYLWGEDWVGALMPLRHDNPDVKPFEFTAEAA